MKSSRANQLAALGAGVLALLHAATFLGTGPIDDDYIVYRYASNWASGAGPVFNVGERIEGFTVPLWVLVHTLGAWLRWVPEYLSVGLGWLGSGVAAWASARAWNQLSTGRRWPVPALILALSPAVAWHAVAGLGTTWMMAFVALWLASWLAARSQAPVAASVWIGVGALLRPELVLFGAPFAWTEVRRRRWLTPTLALAPVASWAVFRWVYYGALAPVSLGVKKLDVWTDLTYGGAYLWSALPTLGYPILLALILGTRPWSRDDDARAPLASAATGVLVYSSFVVFAGGDFVPLSRFFVPAFPALLLLAFAGLTDRITRWPRLFGLAALGATALLQIPQFDRGDLRADHVGQTLRWKAIGQTFACTLPAEATIATAPVGAIGYHSGRTIVDTLGRTHRAFLGLEPDLQITLKGHHRHSAKWVLAQEPDVIVLGNGLLFEQENGRPELILSAWDGDFVTEPAFGSDYRAMQLPIDGSYPLIFFLRRGAEPPAGATPTSR